MKSFEPESAGRAIDQAVKTLAYLREPGRCDWDRKQTLGSLAPYLIEEAYEAVDANHQQDMPALRDELGDVLLQVLFQSMIAQEIGAFTLRDVALSLRHKLIRRHPHLLEPNGQPAPAGRLAPSWEELKAFERPRGVGPLDGIPAALPALLKAGRTQEKAGIDDGDRPARTSLREKLRCHTSWLSNAIDDDSHVDESAATVQAGDLLFHVVRMVRLLGVEPEQALHLATQRFREALVPPI